MSKEINGLYEFGRYRLDVEDRVLFRDGQAVALPPKAVEVLAALVERNDQVVSKEQLMNLLWKDAFVEEANLTQHIFLLRKVFNEDGEGRKYIETIPRRGYRFIADVKVITPAPALQKIDSARSPQIIEKHTFAKIITEETMGEATELRPIANQSLNRNAQKLLSTGNTSLWKNRKAHLALLILVLLTSTIALTVHFIRPRQPEIKTVAVLPLKSLEPNEDDSSLGLKLADALIQRLGRLRQLVVRPTGAVRMYEGKTLDPLVAGREQRVDAVLDGSFQRAGERLHIRVQLLRVSDGKQLWTKTFAELSADPFFLQDALAEQTAQALVPELGGAERRLVARHDTENVEANRLYTEGRYYWNKRNLDGLKRSIVCFEQAIKLDPNYARAYAGLADSHITLSDYEMLPAIEFHPKAKEAVQKALAIDDSLAEAYTALAMIKANYDWDWGGADRDFQQAIEKNPHYATARQWYAEFLTGMGRHQEALEQIHQAQQLDPLSLIIQSIEASNLNYARDYDGAIAQCKRVISRDPSFGEVYAYLGFAYEQKGMFREAMEAYQNWSTLMGNNTPAAAAIRGSAIPDSRDYWRKMVELAKPPTGSEFDAAQAWSQLGEPAKALELLEQAYAKRDYQVRYLKVHPNLDPLRADPRFQDLLRRTNLAE